MVALPFGLQLTRGGARPSTEPFDGMPQGPFDQRRGDPEVGAPGTVYYSGFLDAEEYNKDLQGEKAIEVYRKMMASDGTVKAMMRALTLPMRGATPKFDPASDDDRDVTIAQVCEALLLKMGGQTWDDFIRQAFTGTLGYGFSVFEQVWTRPGAPKKDENGRTVATLEPNYVAHEGRRYLAPYKLAPRLQKTIYRWEIDKTGELLGVQQRVWHGTLEPGTEIPVGESWPPIPVGTYHYVSIPVDRLFVFVLEREGANFLGQSVLRSAYKHWWYKQNGERIDALAAERQGVGVPYAITKQGIRPAEQQAIIGALRTLHAHEKGYLIANEAQLADGAKVGMPPMGILDMRANSTEKSQSLMLYHDRQMGLSILADFLSLGSGTGGNANVMHRDKTSLFYQNLIGIKKPFEDTFVQAIVRPFVRLNFGEDAALPDFKLTGLEAKDLEARGRGLAALFQVGALTPTAETENQLRAEMDLPPLPEDEQGQPVYPETTPPTMPGPTTPEDVDRRKEQRDAMQEAMLNPDQPAPGSLPDERGKVPMNTGLPNPAGKSPAGSQKVLADDPKAAAVLPIQRKIVTTIQNAAKRLRAAQEPEPREQYTEADFESAGHSTLFQGMLEAMAVALGGRVVAGRLSGVDPATAHRAESWVMRAAQDQRPYLRDFASGIVKGDVSPKMASARAEQYAGPAWESLQRGKVLEDPDTIWVWATQQDGQVCDKCAARDGERYRDDELDMYGYPGDGDYGEFCDGGPNCRCTIDPLVGAWTSPDAVQTRFPGGPHENSVRVLSEARCGTCRRWVGRNVNEDASVFCPRCRTDRPVTAA